MKTRPSFARSLTRTLAVPAIIAFAALLPGCVTPRAMTSGAGVPASEGTVNVTGRDSNDNTKVSVEVRHLAEPWKVAADAKVYVVWIQPQKSAIQSLGVLALDDNLEGRLDAVTPHRSFLLLVTPEPNGQVTQPTHEAVFSSQVDNTSEPE
jgi:hypothetical protein